MNTQNLQSDKLDLIGWIHSLQDVSLIASLKELQNKAITGVYESSLKPMSQEDLINRAQMANKAINNNETIIQDKLRQEVKSWKVWAFQF